MSGEAEQEPPAKVQPAKLAKLAGLVAAGIVLLAFGVLALQVDDWSRDLTVNVAETAEGAADPVLRPIVTQRSSDEVAAAVKAAAAELSGWQLAGESSSGAKLELAFVRTTRLFRFKDDITVWVTDGGAQRTLTARSASRVGKGDLGQNPRNLAALLNKVREELGAD